MKTILSPLLHHVNPPASQYLRAMADCALPPKLRGVKHNDWPFPFNRISRGWNAYGSRCPVGSKGFRPWPPRLEEGRGVARWELAGAGSIVDIPGLAKVKIKGGDIYGHEFEAYERNPGSPLFNQKITVRLIDPRTIWNLTVITDTETPEGWKMTVEPNIYSPSALQKFSESGWMKLEPEYYSYWNVLKQRELPWLKNGAVGESPEDTVMFYRSGMRPDHADAYFNGNGIVPVGHVGLKWE